MGAMQLGTVDDSGDPDGHDGDGRGTDADRIGRLAAELHEVVGTVRSRADLNGLEMPELDQLCARRGLDRGTAIATAIGGIEDADYRQFFEILLPLPFESGQRWRPLGRKYISEADAGRGVHAGFVAFGVTTWDGLNAPLRELDGESRRMVAERMLARSLAEPPTGSKRRSPLVLVGVAGLGVLIALVTATLVFAANSGTDSADGSESAGQTQSPDDSPSERVASETLTATDTGASTTTVSLPESGLAGIQPGVETIGGDDLSGQLISDLAEEHLIFFGIPDGDVAGLTYYGGAIKSLPASFRYQAFNGFAPDLPECRGMMSRELEAVGLWERQVTWEDGQALVAVGRLATPEMAHELATALSVAAGVDPTECRGLSDFNIDDYEEYGVTRRDDPTLLTDVAFNHWAVDDVVLPGGAWEQGHRIIVEHGPYVIDVVLASDNPALAGDGHVTADIAGQIISRLEA